MQLDYNCNNQNFFGKCSNVFYIFGIVILFIMIYAVYLYKKYGEERVLYDPLNKMVFEAPFLENCCSWWPISHFILFFFLGIAFPHCDLLIIGAGILWEVFEMIMSKIFAVRRQAMTLRTGNVEYSQNWWAGSFKDIIMNIAGFYSGKLLYLAFLK